MFATPFSSLRTALIAALFAIVPVSTFAQGGMLGGMQGDGIGGRPFKVVINGGLTVPNGKLKSVNENGFHFGASVVYKIPGLPFAVRPEFTYTSFRFRQSVVPSGSLGEKNYTRALTGLGHIELPFSNGLYVFGGLGGMNLASVIAHDSTTRTNTAFMVDVGSGVRFEFGPIQAFLEARYGTAAADADKFSYARATIIPLSFGFVF